MKREPFDAFHVFEDGINKLYLVCPINFMDVSVPEVVVSYGVLCSPAHQVGVARAENILQDLRAGV